MNKKIDKKWNWPIILILLTTICIWSSVCVIGLWTTFISVVIGGCIGGIYFKIKEDTRV